MVVEHIIVRASIFDHLLFLLNSWPSSLDEEQTWVMGFLLTAFAVHDPELNFGTETKFRDSPGHPHACTDLENCQAFSFQISTNVRKELKCYSPLTIKAAHFFPCEFNMSKS